MEMTGITEAGLIARILTGEKELFHELIRPYERMVYLTLFSILRNETEALERKEFRVALRVAVTELPGIYRQVFTLRDLEELNIEETAQALGITTGAVKVRLHRARLMLQKRLVPYLKTTAPARRGFFGRAL